MRLLNTVRASKLVHQVATACECVTKRLVHDHREHTHCRPSIHAQLERVDAVAPGNTERDAIRGREQHTTVAAHNQRIDHEAVTTARSWPPSKADIPPRHPCLRYVLPFGESKLVKPPEHASTGYAELLVKLTCTAAVACIFFRGLPSLRGSNHLHGMGGGEGV